MEENKEEYMCTADDFLTIVVEIIQRSKVSSGYESKWWETSPSVLFLSLTKVLDRVQG